MWELFIQCQKCSEHPTRYLLMTVLAVTAMKMRNLILIILIQARKQKKKLTYGLE